jgi:hypothetical protein
MSDWFRLRSAWQHSSLFTSLFSPSPGKIIRYSLFTAILSETKQHYSLQKPHPRPLSLKKREGWLHSEKLWNPTYLFIRYSLFDIHYSIFIIRYSLFDIHYSIFIIRFSLFDFHYSIFIIRFSFFTFTVVAETFISISAAGLRLRSTWQHSSLPCFLRRQVKLFVIHFSLFTLHFSLFTLHSSLFTFHFSLFTLHSSLFTFHSSLFIPKLFTVIASCHCELSLRVKRSKKQNEATRFSTHSF